jgi:hypothetical protein
MSDSKSSSGGAGFTSLLLVAFIVLKLCGVIDWSWWWVLSPVWVSLAIWGLVAIGIGIYYRFHEKKIVNKRGEFKSKWDQRLEEMRESQRKMEELKAKSK